MLSYEPPVHQMQQQRYSSNYKMPVVRIMTPPESSVSSADSSPSSVVSPPPPAKVVPQGNGYILSIKAGPTAKVAPLQKPCGHSLYLPCRCLQTPAVSVYNHGQLVRRSELIQQSPQNNLPQKPKPQMEVLRRPRMQFSQPAKSRSRSVVTNRHSVTAAPSNADFKDDMKQTLDQRHSCVYQLVPKTGTSYHDYQRGQQRSPVVVVSKQQFEQLRRNNNSTHLNNNSSPTIEQQPQPTTNTASSYQQRNHQSNQQVNGPSPQTSTSSTSQRITSAQHQSPSQISSSSNFSVPLVTIRLQPDADGRFGFNVKGGADQQMPVVVSRVAANTPADRSIPRLREGDLILSVNGRDPNEMRHDDVVKAIRTTREEGNGDLVLVVRPQLQVPMLDLSQMNNNTSSPSALRSNSSFNQQQTQQLVSTQSNLRNSQLPNALHQSIRELRDCLQSNQLTSRFDRLERKNASMSVSVAVQPENLPKNRYRDITPYDDTRVKIKNRPNGQGGDYINASHVNMEIQGAGVVNRYICCQGPLPHTSADFWQMIWEQQSSLVVMLTAQMEQGMVKCHQYWPKARETVHYEHLQVTCHRENILPSGSNGGIAERQLTLVNLNNKEERSVTQLQYMAWPDHGVPDDPRSFIEFVQRVRSLRAGTVEPTVVHCSAGIGRTGVILLVETAMSLIEAKQAIEPIDIVRRLRNQRAMLVQNTSQFVFACNAILRIFDEQIITPLER